MDVNLAIEESWTNARRHDLTVDIDAGGMQIVSRQTEPAYLLHKRTDTNFSKRPVTPSIELENETALHISFRGQSDGGLRARLHIIFYNENQQVDATAIALNQTVKIQVPQAAKSASVAVRTSGVGSAFISTIAIRSQNERIIDLETAIQPFAKPEIAKNVKLGNSTLLKVDCSSDQTIALTQDPIYFKITIDDVQELIIGIDARSTTGPAVTDKSAVITPIYRDVYGEAINYVGPDIPVSPRIGPYRYLPTSKAGSIALYRFFPPNGAHTIEVGIASWGPLENVVVANCINYTKLHSGVTVIVPAYRASATIGRCLDSIRHQDLPAGTLQVIVACNGPEDHFAQGVMEIVGQVPDIEWLVLHDDTAGVSRARNRAISQCTRRYVIFLDADDELEPRYIANMLEYAGPTSVVFSGIVDVTEKRHIVQSAINHQINKHLGSAGVSLPDISTATTLNACKCIPAYYLKQVKYNEMLKSSEDVVLFTEIFCRFKFLLVVGLGGPGTRYVRHITEGSISRRAADRAFMVSDRIDVIEKLNYLRMIYTKKGSDEERFVSGRIAAQVGFIGAYCREYPTEWAGVSAEIRARNIPDFPYAHLNERAAADLVISYCFPPYADTSAIVMAKRTAAWSRPFDVIHNKMTARDRDASLLEIVSPSIGHRFELDAPPTFSNVEGIREFAERCLDQIKERPSTRPIYRRIYSRSMWPASHFAAMVVKAYYPSVEWTAEYSDPVMFDIHDQERVSLGDFAWLWNDQVCELLRSNGVERCESNNAFRLCEWVGFAAADKVVFTNHSQLEYMIGRSPDKDAAARALKISRIEPQPVPSAELYTARRSEYRLSPECINIGYFGATYETRGLGVLLKAIGRLGVENRNRVRLHIFSAQIGEIAEAVSDAGLCEWVLPNGPIGYLECLELMSRIDVLVVIDASTELEGFVNPYLPSKLSDYAGADRRVWAIVEDGSPLSRSEVPFYVSNSGDADSVYETLTEIACSSVRQVRSGNARRMKWEDLWKMVKRRF